MIKVGFCQTDGRTDRGNTVYPLPLRGAGVLKGKCFQTYALCYLMADNAKNPFVHLVSCFFYIYKPNVCVDDTKS
jgi:hypothetical protein